MKTTLDLDDELLRGAKQKAAQEGTTLTAVVERALRDLLFAPGVVKEGYRLDWPAFDFGGPMLIDPADRQALYEVLDREHDEMLYGDKLRKPPRPKKKKP